MTAVAAALAPTGDLVTAGVKIHPHAAAVAPFPVEVVHEYGYRMRAYDETLGELVYWTAIYIDSTGAEYAGPGPLVSIIVSHVIGT